MNTGDIIKLIDRLDTSKLNFLEYNTNDFTIKLGTEAFSEVKEQETASEILTDVIPVPIVEEKNVSHIREDIKQHAKDGYEVKSPIVGVFYEAQSPGKPPIVSVGDRVKKGDTLCIIEAMKVMNEIVSEVDGVILSIEVNNGELVEYNQVLFSIKED